MKIGVSSYSYRQLVANDEMDELEIIMHSKKLGFDTIEYIPFYNPEGNLDIKKRAKEIREKCIENNLELTAYAVGADFITGSDGDLNQEIEMVKRQLDIAHILGVKKFRHDATTGFPKDYKGSKSFDEILPRLAKGCRAVTEYAEQFGIETMIENHGFYMQDSSRVEKLVNAVNHKNFGLLLDIGNFMCVDEKPEYAVGKLIEFAKHVHIKDFHFKDGKEVNPGEGWFMTRSGNYLRGAIVGHGDVNVAKCINIIKNYGYEGTLSLEFEGLENPLKGLKLGLNNVKRFLL